MGIWNKPCILPHVESMEFLQSKSENVMRLEDGPPEGVSSNQSDPEQIEPGRRESVVLGEWRIEPDLNRLVGEDGIHVLEPKVMDVLMVLARNGGQLTSRDELLSEVWNDAYMGDDPTTRAISELRKALGDSPREPRYIETIRGKGYRLLTPVVWSSRPTPSSPSRRTPNRLVLGGLGAIVLIVVGMLLYRSSRPPELPREAEPVALRRSTVTSYPGREMQPALSPDGSRIAFSWAGEGEGELDIYLKQTDSGQAVRLTESRHPEWGPVWSTDATHIAFVRLDENGCGIFALPAIGGAEQLLTRCRQAWLGFDWSPDDSVLFVADQEIEGDPIGVWRVDLTDGGRRQLTTPPAPHYRDTSPRVSPDGKWVAFRRKMAEGQFEIFLVPSGGGEERQLTFERQDNGGFDWAPDSRSIVFSSNRGGLFSLWRVSFYGEVEPLGIEDAYLPAVADRADRLVFEKRSLDIDLWEVGNPFVEPSPKARRWSTSTQHELDPQFSPSGTRAAFVSQRSGSYELWVADADGGDARQLTFFAEPAPGWTAAVQHPRWSGDGEQILFSARADGDFDVFTVRAQGGVPHPVTSDVADDVSPVWMADGRWIYYVSNRTGRWEIWRLGVDGGRPEQVTFDGVEPVIESRDGERIYFQRDNQLLSLDPADGMSESFLDFGSVADWGLSGDGIYYMTEDGLCFYDFATRSKRQQPLPPGPPAAGGAAVSHSGLAISPDGRTIVYAGRNRAEADIVMVEGLFGDGTG